MSHLLTCADLTKSFGPRPLFEGISLTIHERDRIGLIGPNGAGKSTLLKILAGVEDSDGGSIILRRGTRVSYLPQSESFPSNLGIDDVLLEHTESALPDEQRYQRIGAVKNLVGLPSNNPYAGELSGGWKKRLAVATRLLHDPDILLLDEPTNHLDLDGILWLESFLKEATFASVVISHDRMFLENTTNRTIEVNRRYARGFIAVDGSYSEYLVRRDEILLQLQKEEAVLANTARRELEWLRRGPKARTTKASARIQRAEGAIESLSEARARSNSGGSAGIDFSATGRETKQLIVCEGIEKSFGGRKLFSKLSVKILKGIKLGIVGGNGQGKSTVLKILAGSLTPDAGEVFRAQNLRVVTFDQQRDALAGGGSLRRFLAPDSDSVIFQERELHVTSYAARFLFTHQQLETPVTSLSGGEQARLLIAKLMLQPADVLLLDEPTNDLDIDTLQMLEENLSQFPGAVVLISHDRLMMEGVCTQFLAISDGKSEYYATFDQWMRERRADSSDVTGKPKSGAKPATKDELATLLKIIAKAEAELKSAEERVNSLPPTATPEEIEAACELFSTKQTTVEELYARWMEIEGK